jgi:hypothetical protein
MSDRIIGARPKKPCWASQNDRDLAGCAKYCRFGAQVTRPLRPMLMSAVSRGSNACSGV